MNLFTKALPYLISLTMLFLACGSEEVSPPPSDLIPEEEFVEMLVEMNLIEAVRSLHLSKEKENKVETEEFYNELWERKGIEEERFLRSFDHYRKDPEKMSELYKQAADLIKRKEDLLLERERQEADSSKE